MPKRSRFTQTDAGDGLILSDNRADARAAARPAGSGRVAAPRATAEEGGNSYWGQQKTMSPSTSRRGGIMERPSE